MRKEVIKMRRDILTALLLILISVFVVSGVFWVFNPFTHQITELNKSQPDVNKTPEIHQPLPSRVKKFSNEYFNVTFIYPEIVKKGEYYSAEVYIKTKEPWLLKNEEEINVELYFSDVDNFQPIRAGLFSFSKLISESKKLKESAKEAKIEVKFKVPENVSQPYLHIVLQPVILTQPGQKIGTGYLAVYSVTVSVEGIEPKMEVITIDKNIVNKTPEEPPQEDYG